MQSSVLSLLQHDATSRSTLTLLCALLVSSILTNLGTPVRHSLLTSAVAWLSICTYCTLKTSANGLLAASRAKRIAWISGGLFALAQVCERAVGGTAIWWAKALLPAVIYMISKANIIEDGTDDVRVESPTNSQKPTQEAVGGSQALLVVLTLSALAAVYSSTASNTTIAVGLAFAVLSSLASLLVRRALSEAQNPRENGGSVIYSANGFLAQPVDPAGDDANVFLSVGRDLSAAAAAISFAFVFMFEPWPAGGLSQSTQSVQVVNGIPRSGNAIPSIASALAITLVHLFMDGTLLLLIHRRGAFLTSFVPVSAIVLSRLVLDLSLGRAWFAILYAASAFTFFDETDALFPGSRQKWRVPRILTLIAIVSFAGLAVFEIGSHRATSLTAPIPNGGFLYGPPTEPLLPLQPQDKHTHPIEQLTRDAEASMAKIASSQSQTLDAAVAEYKRRYGVLPPPNFDKWYEFAKSKKVQLIDEYDTIYRNLLPFWAVSPATLRARVREALGYEANMLIGVLIREGKAVNIAGGPDWQQEATVGMMQQFLQYLPDMDLAFNIHDEPRVVVPHDELSRLVHRAVSESLPQALASKAPINSFSARPQDLGNGNRMAEAKVTRFNTYAHQPTWIPSRMSCSPDSAARPIDEAFAADNLTAYALGDLGFIHNHTSFTDICNSPSFQHSYGFFDRPNAYNLVHDLFPIFSQSKISSYQDILYPSPWYWFGKVSYNEGQDMTWVQKIGKLWWRGSTTGGFSRDGGWRRQHRQQMIKTLNAIDEAQILTNTPADASSNVAGGAWSIKEVPRKSFEDLMDVHFSHIGQCDPGDCDAQKEFFNVVKPAEQQEAWKFKYLLDIDGNAFSGRFYAFLMSHSLTFKMNVFREWHEEWIKPWVHYVPLSLRGDDGLEAVRYFAQEEQGKEAAVRMAEASTSWANKVLRNEDFEAWFFRLLLEYGRLVDDNRANIGYSGL